MQIYQNKLNVLLLLFGTLGLERRYSTKFSAIQV